MSEELELVNVFNFENEELKIFKTISKAKVDGGYIYSEALRMKEQITNSLVFVPDVDLTRYQAHLRDAYNQGFKDAAEIAREDQAVRTDIP